jgi:hypothetical protein
MYLGRADMLCPATVSRFVPGSDICGAENAAYLIMIDLLAVEEPKPKPAKIRAVSYEAAIDQLFKRMRSASSATNPTSGQYSQGPGTQRKTSPSTATWQTDGNDR